MRIALMEEQIAAIKEYVEAKIDWRVGSASGHDAMEEYARLVEAEDRLTRVLGEEP